MKIYQESRDLHACRFPAMDREKLRRLRHYCHHFVTVICKRKMVKMLFVIHYIFYFAHCKKLLVTSLHKYIDFNSWENILLTAYIGTTNEGKEIHVNKGGANNLGRVSTF